VADIIDKGGVCECNVLSLAEIDTADPCDDVVVVDDVVHVYTGVELHELIAADVNMGSVIVHVFTALCCHDTVSDCCSMPSLMSIRRSLIATLSSSSSISLLSRDLRSPTYAVSISLSLVYDGDFIVLSVVSDISESICDVSDSIALGEVSGGNCGALLFRGDRFLDISCAILEDILGDVVDVMFM